MKLGLALSAVLFAPMDDDSGLGGICGGSSGGTGSHCPNMDNDAAEDGSDGDDSDGQQMERRPDPYWPNGLMNFDSAERAEERGELKNLPSREAFTRLREALNELKLPQPRVEQIPELVGALVHQVHSEENIPLNYRGEKMRFRPTPYDYNTLRAIGYLDGVVNVWRELKGMAPVSFGENRTYFEESLVRMENIILRWLSMRPDGIPDSVMYPEVDLFKSEEDSLLYEIRNIRKGKYDYDSDDERVQRDSYEDEATECTNDANEISRQLVRHQASHFACHQLAELVEFLKRTGTGKEIYEAFRQDLTARHNRGTYPTTPIDDEFLEKFLIPRKIGRGERDI